MSAAPPQTGLRIGEVARRAGTTPRTIRYYEELGLLPATPERGMYLRCVFDTHGFSSSRPLACWALRV